MVTATGRPAFDRVAAAYDARFTERALGRLVRERVQRRLAEVFALDHHVLELGCGTGEDAVWLARRGVRVTATDAAPAMLEAARAKAIASGVGERITFAQLALDTHGVSAGAPGERFDGAFSSFGALNCVADRTPVARMLAGCLRPGARVALVVMGPVCAWEIGWHLARGRPAAAVRRFRQGELAHIGDGVDVRVWYPSPRRLRAEFAPWFRPTATTGIGVLLPPSYLNGLLERHRRVFGRLAGLEDRIAGHFPWNRIADHYLLTLERR